MRPPQFRTEYFDYHFRPESYFEPEDPVRELPINIKGESRRKLLAELANDIDTGVEDILFREILTESERITLGLVHPRLMGGEYLPDRNPNQVEIARIVLDSTTQDVLSLRAEKSSGLIAYHLVDEYEFEYVVFPEFSMKPLTFDELIALFGSVQDLTNNRKSIPSMFREYFEIEPRTTYKEISEWTKFVEFHSEFYPQLNEFYREEATNWAKELSLVR